MAKSIFTHSAEATTGFIKRFTDEIKTNNKIRKIGSEAKNQFRLDKAINNQTLKQFKYQDKLDEQTKLIAEETAKREKKA